MIKADKRVMECFLSPPGQIILEFLVACQQKATQDTVHGEGEATLRSQGAARELEEIVTMGINAQTALAKMR